MIKCTECGSSIPHDRVTCPTCGAHAGFPNVREVSSTRESEALELRYKKAMKETHAEGRGALLDAFSQVCEGSYAAIAVNLDCLVAFMTHDEELYSSYNLMVSGEVRKAASDINDKKRRGVEGFFFGGYAHEIRYAALALDGKGLSSYGAFTMVLKDIAVKKRATVLEENSYKFYDKHKMDIPDNFPQGFRSVWSDRHKLAVAKLAERITVTTRNHDFSSILLSSTGDRFSDDFIEVHIYGAFDNAAVEAVVGNSKGSNKQEKAQLAVVRDKLKNKSIQWVES